MKKEIFQIILFITCSILFCMAGCSTPKKLESKFYVVTWRKGDLIKFKGLHRVYTIAAKFSIKPGDTLYMMPNSKFTPARF